MKDPNAVALGRKGGQSKSKKKQKASRLNGAKNKGKKGLSTSLVDKPSG